jgi:hypothetical protein
MPQSGLSKMDLANGPYEVYGGRHDVIPFRTEKGSEWL